MYVYIRVYYTDWILVKKQNQCCTEKLTLQNTLLSLLLLSLLSLSLLLLSLLVLVLLLLLCIRTHPGGFLSSMHCWPCMSQDGPRMNQANLHTFRTLWRFIRALCSTKPPCPQWALPGCILRGIHTNSPGRLAVSLQYATLRNQTIRMKLLIRMFTEVAFNSTFQQLKLALKALAGVAPESRTRPCWGCLFRKDFQLTSWQKYMSCTMI